MLSRAGQLQEAMKRPTPSTNLADTQRHLQQLDSQIRKDVEGQQQQQKVGAPTTTTTTTTGIAL